VLVRQRQKFHRVGVSTYFRVVAACEQVVVCANSRATLRACSKFRKGSVVVTPVMAQNASTFATVSSVDPVSSIAYSRATPTSAVKHRSMIHGLLPHDHVQT
jgi:hypothetical protein